MDCSTNRVIVGRFGRTHGIRGNIIIHSFTEPYDNILSYSSSWHVFLNRQWRPIKPLSIKVQSKHIIAQIEGYETLEDVSVLTNIDIAIPRDCLAPLPPGEFYWYELIGMKVNDTKNTTLGCVTEVMSTGSNDVLVVEGEKRHLIPFLLKQFVLSIDKEHGEILVDWDSDF